MSIDVNDEILQDFLVEAGEILEQLSEQLVDLEQQPDDYDLLNAVFRGFHTIKGGAGFLAIDPLVEVCHRSEDVFNILRQGQRPVTPDLMDAVLEVLDVVNVMFNEVREGTMPDHADPSLIQRLNSFAVPAEEESEEGETEEAEEVVVEEAVATTAQTAEAGTAHDSLSDDEFEDMLEAIQAPTATPAGEDISEDEFESLLDELHGKGKFSGKPAEGDKETAAKAPPASDDISEEEFDNLLDQIHGKGQFDPDNLPKKAPAAQPKKGAEPPASDEITEDEFDALLDQIHGEGKFDPQKVKSGDAPAQKKSAAAPAKGKKAVKAKTKPAA
ncbi:MAG: Hpt domain-containing protein, partial [Candidatus Thiodiazotropha sp. (ex Notomyrtea botanica)]|nr:Hpt domain-containing protein [Candidatus Thiodiazotropha sp. (ex Notomyrtea botanica)]